MARVAFPNAFRHVGMPSKAPLAFGALSVKKHTSQLLGTASYRDKIKKVLDYMVAKKIDELSFPGINIPGCKDKDVSLECIISGSLAYLQFGFDYDNFAVSPYGEILGTPLLPTQRNKAEQYIGLCLQAIKEGKTKPVLPQDLFGFEAPTVAASNQPRFNPATVKPFITQMHLDDANMEQLAQTLSALNAIVKVKPVENDLLHSHHGLPGVPPSIRIAINKKHAETFRTAANVLSTSSLCRFRMDEHRVMLAKECAKIAHDLASSKQPVVEIDIPAPLRTYDLHKDIANNNKRYAKQLEAARKRLKQREV